MTSSYGRGRPTTAKLGVAAQDAKEQRWVKKGLSDEPGDPEVIEEDFKKEVTEGMEVRSKHNKIPTDKRQPTVGMGTVEPNEEPPVEGVLEIDAATRALLAERVSCLPGDPGIVNAKLSGLQLGPTSAAALAQCLDEVLGAHRRENSGAARQGPAMLWANLELNDNDAGDAAVTAMLDTLEAHQVSIKRADLRGNGITDRSALRLALAIYQQPLRVEEVDLSCNGLSSRSLIGLCMGVAQNRRTVAISALTMPCWLRLESNCIADPIDVLRMLRSRTQISSCVAVDRRACGPQYCTHCRDDLHGPAIHLYALPSQRLETQVHVNEVDLADEVKFWEQSPSWKALSRRLDERPGAERLCVLLACAQKGTFNFPIDKEQVDLTRCVAGDELEDESTNPSVSSDFPRDETAASEHSEGFPSGGVSAGRHLLSMLRQHGVPPPTAPDAEPPRTAVSQHPPPPPPPAEPAPWLGESLEEPWPVAQSWDASYDGYGGSGGYEGYTGYEGYEGYGNVEEDTLAAQVAEQVLRPPEAGSKALPDGAPHVRGWVEEAQALRTPREAQVWRSPEAVAVEAITCSDATAVAVVRADVALSEGVKALKLEPHCLKETLKYVVTEGWHNITWRNGYTGLHLAAEHGRDDIAPLLVALGADPCARDSRGRTPLEIARKWEHLPAAWVLTQLETCQSFEDVVEVASRRRAALASRDALPPPPPPRPPAARVDGTSRPWAAPFGRLGASEEERTQEFRRLKFALCEVLALLQADAACIKAVLYMVATGCSGVETQGWFTTAFHLAAELGRDDLMPLLRALGADPRALDSDGKTPLDVARSQQHWGSVWKLTEVEEEHANGHMAAGCSQSGPLRLRMRLERDNVSAAHMCETYPFETL